MNADEGAGEANRPDAAPAPSDRPSVPQGEPPAPALSRESHRSLARRILDRLDQSPTIKLLVIAWVVGSSVLTPFCAWMKGRDEARRLGLLEPPGVSLGFSGDECVLVNIDRRPVAEATITWDVYWVDVTACHVGGHLSGAPEVSPATAERSLPPRDKLRAKFDRAVNCRDNAFGCGKGSDCRMVVECRGKYHRLEDLEEYRQSVHALSGPDCGALRPVSTLFAYGERDGKGRIAWKDPADQRAIECFLAGRSEADAFLAEAKAASKRVDEMVPLK